jgi:hypothetical protein
VREHEVYEIKQCEENKFVIVIGSSITFDDDLAFKCGLKIPL